MLVWFAQNLKLVVSWGCCKFAAKLNQNQHPWCCENAFAKQHDLGVVVTPAPLNDSIGRCDGAIKKKITLGVVVMPCKIAYLLVRHGEAVCRLSNVSSSMLAAWLVDGLHDQKS